MANPKGNEATLKKFQPKWQNGATRTIRVPIALADQILEYAHKIDESATQVNNLEVSNAIANQATIPHDTLTQVIDVLESIENSKRFSRELRAKLTLDVIEPLKALTQVN
jgi:hypothetical protein